MCNSKDNLCNVSFCFFHFIKITSAPLFIGSPTYFCGRRSLHTSFCAPYKNLLKPSEAPKYYAVARSGRKVTVKEVCKRITERSSYSKGELEGCIGEFLLEIVNVLNEGNIVQMGDLGNFRMSLKTATATATEKEFKASCIEKGKVLFYPGSDLRKLCKTLDFALYKSDGKPDSGDEPLPDDGKGDQPGGGSGDDGDEAPDPTV